VDVAHDMRYARNQQVAKLFTLDEFLTTQQIESCFSRKASKLQHMTNKYSNEHTKVKNPNWQKTDQLAIYKRSREIELGATENNIS